MSLEAALAEHTAALQANTAALIASNEGRDKAIAAAENLKSGDSKPSTRKKAADTPPAETAPQTAAPAESGPAATIEDVKSVVGSWLAIDEGDERQRRAKIVQSNLAEANAKFGTEAKKVTELSPDGVTFVVNAIRATRAAEEAQPAAEPDDDLV